MCWCRKGKHVDIPLHFQEEIVMDYENVGCDVMASGEGEPTLVYLRKIDFPPHRSLHNYCVNHGRLHYAEDIYKCSH